MSVIEYGDNKVGLAIGQDADGNVYVAPLTVELWSRDSISGDPGLLVGRAIPNLSVQGQDPPPPAAPAGDATTTPPAAPAGDATTTPPAASGRYGPATTTTMGTATPQTDPTTPPAEPDADDAAASQTGTPTTNP